MAEINEKGVFFDKEYLFWRNFLLAEFSVPLPPKQKLEMIWKIGNHLENPDSFEIIRKIGSHLENPDSFEIIRKIGSHLEKNPDSFETIRKIGNHLEKSGSFWKYWDSLKGFFVYTRKNFPDAQKLSG